MTKLTQFVYLVLSQVFKSDSSSVERHLRQGKVKLAAMRSADLRAVGADGSKNSGDESSSSLISVMQNYTDSIDAAGTGVGVDPYEEGGVWPENRDAIATNEFLLQQTDWVKRRCIPELQAELDSAQVVQQGSLLHMEGVEHRSLNLGEKEDLERLLWCVNEIYSADADAAWISSSTVLDLEVAFGLGLSVEDAAQKSSAVLRNGTDVGELLAAAKKTTATEYPSSGESFSRVQKAFVPHKLAALISQDGNEFIKTFPKSKTVDLFFLHSLDRKRYSLLIENLSGAPFLRREALRSKLHPYLFSAAELADMVREEKFIHDEDVELVSPAKQELAANAAAEYERRDVLGTPPDGQAADVSSSSLTDMASVPAVRSLAAAEGMGKEIQVVLGDGGTADHSNIFGGAEKGRMVGPEVVLSAVNECWAALMPSLAQMQKAVDAGAGAGSMSAAPASAEVGLGRLQKLLCRKSARGLVARKRLVLRLSNMNRETLQAESFHLRIPHADKICDESASRDALPSIVHEMRQTLNEIVTLFQESLALADRVPIVEHVAANKVKEGNAAVAALHASVSSKNRAEEEKRIQSKYSDLASLALKALSQTPAWSKFLALNVQIHAQEEKIARSLRAVNNAREDFRSVDAEDEAKDMPFFYQTIDPAFYKVLKVRGDELQNMGEKEKDIVEQARAIYREGARAPATHDMEQDIKECAEEEIEAAIEKADVEGADHEKEKEANCDKAQKCAEQSIRELPCPPPPTPTLVHHDGIAPGSVSEEDTATRVVQRAASESEEDTAIPGAIDQNEEGEKSADNNDITPASHVIEGDIIPASHADELEDISIDPADLVPPVVVRSLWKCLFLGASWTRQIQKKRCRVAEASAASGGDTTVDDEQPQRTEESQQTQSSCQAASFAKLPLGSNLPVLVTMRAVEVKNALQEQEDEERGIGSLQAHEVVVTEDAEREILRISNFHLAKIAAMESIDDVREWFYPALNYVDRQSRIFTVSDVLVSTTSPPAALVSALDETSSNSDGEDTTPPFFHPTPDEIKDVTYFLSLMSSFFTNREEARAFFPLFQQQLRTKLMEIRDRSLEFHTAQRVVKAEFEADEKRLALVTVAEHYAHAKHELEASLENLAEEKALFAEILTFANHIAAVLDRVGLIDSAALPREDRRIQRERTYYQDAGTTIHMF